MDNPIIHEDEVITREDLIALPEYSCTIPTGVTIGKRWRCSTKFPYRKLEDDQIEWFIRTYVQDPKDAKMALIVSSWAVDENHKPHRGYLRT